MDLTPSFTTLRDQMEGQESTDADRLSPADQYRELNRNSLSNPICNARTVVDDYDLAQCFIVFPHATYEKPYGLDNNHVANNKQERDLVLQEQIKIHPNKFNEQEMPTSTKLIWFRKNVTDLWKIIYLSRHRYMASLIAQSYGHIKNMRHKIAQKLY
jgi:hypothetical protein